MQFFQHAKFIFPLVAPNQLSQDQADTSITKQAVSSLRVTPLANNSGNSVNPSLSVVGTSNIAGSPNNNSSSPSTLSTTTGNSKDKVMMPSGASLAIMPPAGSSTNTTSVVPAHVAAGIGVGFPMPHPGDGSMDFSKTEMVTPETSLNMSMAAFLAR